MQHIFSMRKLGRIALLAVVTLQVVIFLLPTTIFYIFGMFILVLGFLGANERLTPAFLIIAVPLLIPGYGLYSIWWLVFKIRSVFVRGIPTRIWVGLALGAGSAMLFVLPLVGRGFEPSTPFISSSDLIKNSVLYGGGPLILTISLLLLFWLQNKPAGCQLAKGESSDEQQP